MVIREAEINDIGAIRALYAQLNPGDSGVMDGRDEAVLAEIVNSDLLFLFLGIVDDRIMATCYLNLIPNLSRNASPYGIIENVVVDTEMRNKGYGQEIMRYAIDRAWEEGCYKVMLQTGSRREATHHFYRSCGFDDQEKFAFIAHPDWYATEIATTDS